MPISQFIIGTAFGSLITIIVLELLESSSKTKTGGADPLKSPNNLDAEDIVNPTNENR